MFGIDELSADLDDLAWGHFVAGAPHTTANPILRLKER
jgi:hypothetical protein